MTRYHIATWNSRRHGRQLSLWEGTGRFGERLLATIDQQPTGAWRAVYGRESPQLFADREAALQALSRRASADHDVEVRTSSRIIARRPAGETAA